MKTLPSVFLACIVIFLVSCGGKDKKHAVSPCDSLGAIYKCKTVNRLADMNNADSVLLQASNSKCYLVVSGKKEIKDEQSENEKTSSVISNPSDSDKFCGIDRKTTRTSIANAYTLTYKNIVSFIKSLPADDDMGKTHVPDIRIDTNSKRVEEEKKNIHIKQCWIHAIACEADGDYRIIIGDSPDAGKSVFFNIAISGLPDKNNASYAKLSKARQSFKDFFGINKKIKTGSVFVFSTPVEIEFAGSLFFDKYNFDKKSEMGYKNFKSKTYWEIHPVTQIKYL
jgi:hypothetical protein